jgi:hypothetical protein
MDTDTFAHLPALARLHQSATRCDVGDTITFLGNCIAALGATAPMARDAMPVEAPVP